MIGEPTSVTDTREWRAFCTAAAQDLTLVDSDPNGVLEYIVGPRSMREARYVRVANELDTLFGALAGRDVLEVGAGYGGQALVLMGRGVRRYATVDLPEPQQLQGSFLGSFGYTLDDADGFDAALVVSSYAVSETRADIQTDLLHFMAQVPRGYIRWNGWTTGELSLGQVLALLPDDAVAVPEPEDDRNSIITWGVSSA